MAKQGSEYLLDAEELKTLNAACDVLQNLSGNAIRGKYYQAWVALRDIVRPKAQSEDEVEMARRMA
jgi:hypothetical protein